MPPTVEPPDDLAVRLLESARPSAPAVRNGADLVAHWQTEGLIGSRSDVTDSSDEARRLRKQTQRRGV